MHVAEKAFANANQCAFKSSIHCDFFHISFCNKMSNANVVHQKHKPRSGN